MEILESQELGNKELEPIRYAVEGMIPEGYTVLSALPKMGKSWFVQQMCLAVAQGKEFLGHRTTRGTAIYIALEDCEKFAQDRQNKIGTQGVKGFKYVFKAPPMELGFLDELEELVKGIKDLRLIVVDTLRKIEYQPKGKESFFHCDYKTGTELKEWADRHEVSLVAVTHDRKEQHGDPLCMVSGTGGVTAAADAVVMITKDNRYSDTAKVGVTGRRVIMSVTKIRQNDCVWELLDGDEFKDSKIRQAVLALADLDINKAMGARQIIETARENGVILTESAKAVGAFIIQNMERFRDDGVEIEVKGRGTGANTYFIRRSK